MAITKPITTYIDDRELTLEELQGIVGGYIQVVEINNGKTHIIMDEEGKLKNKSINEEATKIWEDWYGSPLPDVIVGDAVVLTKKALLK